jgi:ABC-2 type transport system ATP-binding protein
VLAPGPMSPAVLLPRLAGMIEVTSISKRYGAHHAVRDISFSCEPGTVTGFLGPNGAGKSTTMRILCGLTRPDSGSATVNGVEYRQLQNPGRTVGVLLDASAQHGGRTGREVLAVSAQVLGVQRKRVDQVLDLVGLAGAAARRRVAGYSLGMRQRLGLAHALLGEPGVLILDEPANGLDPEGIFWMRELLTDFADRGGTVLLSSHLLSEVQAVADRLVVVREGQVVTDGALGELLGATGALVRAQEPESLERALRTAGLNCTRTADGAWLVDADATAVGRAAADAGVALLELRPAEALGLEEMFLALTAADNNKEGTPA